MAAQPKADFIKVPETPGLREQCMPTEPDKRLPSSEIRISLCEEADSEKIAEGIYVCFPQSYWKDREPEHLRPSLSTRITRLANRTIRPSFSNPNMYWVKATHVPTGEIIGIAGWIGPGSPIHNFFRSDATEFYNYKSRFGWSDAELDEWYSHVDTAVWDKQPAEDDAIRKELLGDEPHWYLAPLMTWPEWQGRGVGKLLLQWAIDQADATDPVTPLYLESAPYARPVYMHCGFVPQGRTNFLRRGPAIVRGLEAEEGDSEARQLTDEEGKRIGEMIPLDKAEKVGPTVTAGGAGTTVAA